MRKNTWLLEGGAMRQGRQCLLVCMGVRGTGISKHLLHAITKSGPIHNLHSVSRKGSAHIESSVSVCRARRRRSLLLGAVQLGARALRLMLGISHGPLLLGELLAAGDGVLLRAALRFGRRLQASSLQHLQGERER